MPVIRLMADEIKPFRNTLPLVTGLAALAFSVCLYFPGYLSYDSAYQFWQVRTGHFSNQSSVVMLALWKLVHPLWSSPAAMLTLHFVAYWLGIVLLALQFRERSLPRVAFVLGVGFLPPAFVIMGHLWTDASLIAAMTLALGLTVTGLVRRRLSVLLLALPFILYAGAVRHNSLVAIIPLSALWAQGLLRSRTALPGESVATRRRLAVSGIVVLVVVASFSFGKTLDRMLVRERVSTWALIALFDLAGISARADTMAVPAFARTPGLTLETLKQAYSPFTCVPLFVNPEHVRSGVDGDVFTDDELKALAGAWLSAVARYPLDYAAHRIDVASKLFGRYGGHPEGLFFNPIPVAYKDNPPPEAPLWKLGSVFAEQVRATRGWLIFMPALYMAVAAGVLLHAWRRRESLAGRVALTSAGSGLLLVLPLGILAMSTELRYCGWMFTATLIGLAASLPGSALRDVRE